MSKRKRNYSQGKYNVQKSEKYSGVNHVLKYRSSYELKFMQFCDRNPNIIEWNYEQHVIKYKNPMKLDKNMQPKTCRYILDFWVKWKDKRGEIRTALVEIKPYNQTMPPNRGKKRKDVYESACATWNVNRAKWMAAKKHCEARNWDFKIITERVLFG